MNCSLCFLATCFYTFPLYFFKGVRILHLRDLANGIVCRAAMPGLRHLVCVCLMCCVLHFSYTMASKAVIVLTQLFKHVHTTFYAPLCMRSGMVRQSVSPVSASVRGKQQTMYCVILCAAWVWLWFTHTLELEATSTCMQALKFTVLAGQCKQHHVVRRSTEEQTCLVLYAVSLPRFR